MGSISTVKMTVTRGDDVIVGIVDDFDAATAWVSSPTQQLRIARSVFSRYLPDHFMRQGSVDVVFKTQFNAGAVDHFIAPLLMAVFPGCTARCVSTTGGGISPVHRSPSSSNCMEDATLNGEAP